MLVKKKRVLNKLNKLFSYKRRLIKDSKRYYGFVCTSNLCPGRLKCASLFQNDFIKFVYCSKVNCGLLIDSKYSVRYFLDDIKENMDNRKREIL